MKIGGFQETSLLDYPEKISAIICTHNRAGYLEKALQSLMDQTLTADEYEIIVVDNVSTDQTRRIVEDKVQGATQKCSIKYIAS